MQFPVNATLRPAFFDGDRYVVGHPTGTMQILPRQDLADYQADGWQILILCQGCGLVAHPISAFVTGSPMVQPSPPDNPVRTFRVCPPRSTTGGHECLILAELNAELTEQISTWTDDPQGP